MCEGFERMMKMRLLGSGMGRRIDRKQSHLRPTLPSSYPMPWSVVCGIESYKNLRSQDTSTVVEWKFEGSRVSEGLYSSPHQEQSGYRSTQSGTRDKRCRIILMQATSPSDSLA
jgi:hypothetical protein